MVILKIVIQIKKELIKAQVSGLLPTSPSHGISIDQQLLILEWKYILIDKRRRVAISANNHVRLRRRVEYQ